MFDAPEKPKNKGGRPLGSGHGTQIVNEVRRNLTAAFKILERRKKPLHKLLADQLEVDASKTLNLMGKFLPQQLNMDSFGSEFKLALEDVAGRIAEQNALIKEQNEKTIDVKPEKDSDA